MGVERPYPPVRKDIVTRVTCFFFRLHFALFICLLQEIAMTHTLLSAILHITNIEFAPDETTDGVFIVDEYPMQVGELQNMSRFPQSMVNTYSRAQGQVQ